MMHLPIQKISCFSFIFLYLFRFLIFDLHANHRIILFTFYKSFRYFLSTQTRLLPPPSPSLYLPASGRYCSIPTSGTSSLSPPSASRPPVPPACSRPRTSTFPCP